MTTLRASTPIPVSQGLRAGLLGGGLAALLNVLAHLVGQSLNGGPLEIAPPGSPGPMALPVLAVVLFSLVPGVVAGLLYALLSRFSARPWRWLLGVSLVVLALFFVAPLGAAQSPVTLWTLQIMHVLAALAILWALQRFGRS